MGLSMSCEIPLGGNVYGTHTRRTTAEGQCNKCCGRLSNKGLIIVAATQSDTFGKDTGRGRGSGQWLMSGR